jgi:hypothetical protein
VIRNCLQPSRLTYFFLSGRCDNAEPAAVFESLPVRPSRRTLDAALPALAPVFSFLAMEIPPFETDLDGQNTTPSSNTFKKRHRPVHCQILPWSAFTNARMSR